MGSSKLPDPTVMNKERNKKYIYKEIIGKEYLNECKVKMLVRRECFKNVNS
jgi:hypothetical protein